MNFSKLIGLLVAIIILVGGAGVAQADSLCKNVKFEFKNSHDSGSLIRVVKVKYFDKEDNKWRTEDVKNTECASNATCTTSKDDLEYVGNEDITKVKFIYQVPYPAELGVGADYVKGGWGPNITGGEKKPEYPYCKADKTFRKSPAQPFVIFGTG